MPLNVEVNRHQHCVQIIERENLLQSLLQFSIILQSYLMIHELLILLSLDHYFKFTIYLIIFKCSPQNVYHSFSVFF